MNKNQLISITVFSVVFGVGCLISSRYEYNQVVRHKQMATQLAANTAYIIERQLSMSLSATYALEAILQQYGSVPDFDNLAARMIETYGGISTLELAPNGVIAKAYPLAGNEKAIGHDLLNDPKQRYEAQTAIQTGKLTLAGPFELIQGGVAAVGRLPVFRNKVDGGKQFWGFTTVLIKISDLLKNTHIDQLADAGYIYELWRVGPDSGKPYVFASNRTIEQWSSPVNFSFAVPNGKWTLSVMPKEGWSPPAELPLLCFLSFLFAMLPSVFCKMLLQHSAFRREHANALLRSLEEIRDLYEQAACGYHSVNIDGVIVQINDTELKMIGYTRDQVLGKMKFSDLLSPASLKAYQEEFQQLKKRGWVSNLEFEIIRLDGTILTVLLSATAIKDAAGNYVMSRSTIVDITERKKADEVIKHQLNFLQTLIDTIPSPIFYKDTEGKYLGCNASFEFIFGRPKVEIIGKTAYDIFPRDSADMFTEKNLALFCKPGIQQYDAAVRFADNTVHDILYIIGPSRDIQGNVAGLVGVMIDITDIKKTEDALRDNAIECQSLANKFNEKQRLLHSLINSIPDLIFYKDRESVYLRCNKAFEDFAGRSEESLIGLTDLDIFPRDVAEVCREMDRKMLSKRMACRNEEWVDYPDGRHVLLDTLRTPFYDQEGKVLGLIGISRDITEYRLAEKERERLETQLQHAQKMEAIGQLAGGIAHDFNNILTAIIGYADIMIRRVGKESPLHRYIEQIFTAGKRAAELTNGLLAFSRKQVLYPKPIDLCEVVRGVNSMLVRLIPEDIDFKTLTADEDLIVMADKGQIEQVLMNLATNAKDAMPRGGTLTIEVYRAVMEERFAHAHGSGEPGYYACISVTDTGHGMDEETRNKIFEPFFTTKEVGKGTGLGLAIIYGIIKQHNGYINVYSEPDRGTTFRVYLPLIAGDKDELQDTLQMEPPAGGTETILLAEDDLAVRELHRIILEEAGYKVIEAVDGLDALDKFIEHQEEVDIVATDVIMPKMDGKNLSVEIRKICPDTKFLFISGYTKNTVQERGILDDNLNFIAKPVTSSVLLKKVRVILDHVNSHL